MGKDPKIVMTPQWKAAARELKKLARARVKVGVLAGDKAKTSTSGKASRLDMSIAGVATLHEFGNPRSGHKKRSWLRKTFVIRHAETAAMTAAIARKVMSGELSTRKAMDVLGLWGVGQIKKTILQDPGVTPANSAATVRRKGSSRVLVDRGQLVGAMTHKVNLSFSG